MTKQLIIPIVLLFLFGSTSTAQSNVRAKLRKLELGKSNLAEIKKLFGGPDTIQKETYPYVKGESTKDDVNYYSWDNEYTRQRIKDAPVRNLTAHSYTKLGLEFWLLDNPWELNSIKITNPGLWSNGIRVGDSLATVEKVLGKNGSWWSTDGNNEWTLEYEKLGLQITFLRDPKVPQFPMKLTRKRRVTSIEIVDRRVSFLAYP